MLVFALYAVTVEHEHQASIDRRLSAMLEEMGLQAKRVSASSYDVMFTSDLREWAVNIRLNESWVMLRTFVMVLPAGAPRRLTLLEAALQANASLSLAKFSTTEDRSLVIDLEYRDEHLNAETLRNLVGLVVRVGDENYPKLFRIATGDVALEALESAFKKPTNESDPA
jgi:hypothetical protein